MKNSLGYIMHKTLLNVLVISFFSRPKLNRLRGAAGTFFCCFLPFSKGRTITFHGTGDVEKTREDEKEKRPGEGKREKKMAEKEKGKRRKRQMTGGRVIAVRKRAA